VSVEIRRIYDEVPTADRAHRVLVDRLWPRGVATATAPIDEWAKEVAPSSELRTWFGHDPARFDEFARRYKAELRRQPAADALAGLRARGGQGQLALVTATRDVEHSGARVLCDVLTTARRSPPAPRCTAPGATKRRRA
jgi:uncharacterized protein YeaO (DUF488 family)